MDRQVSLAISFKIKPVQFDLACHRLFEDTGCH
jgi:hypothetical protein